MCADRMVHKQFQEGHYEEACTKFSLAMQKIGYKAGERERVITLSHYSLPLCLYLQISATTFLSAIIR